MSFRRIHLLPIQGIFLPVLFIVRQWHLRMLVTLKYVSMTRHLANGKQDIQPSVLNW